MAPYFSSAESNGRAHARACGPRSTFAGGSGCRQPLRQPRCAHAHGGRHVVVPPTTTYLASELGAALIWGPGAILLGFALFALAAGTPGTLRGWLRIATVVGGIGGILGPAFFPSLLVLIWALVIGIWLIVAGRRRDVTAVPAVT